MDMELIKTELCSACQETDIGKSPMDDCKCRCTMRRIYDYITELQSTIKKLETENEQLRNSENMMRQLAMSYQNQRK